MLLIVGALKKNEHGYRNGHGYFTRICLPAQEQKQEIQMSDLVGSMADGTMGSKAVEVG